MIIRPLSSSDLDELRTIHEKYYKDEFCFDDFISGFLASCVISDESGRIVSAGGMRALAEMVLITNKDCSVRDRREALYMILNASCYQAPRLGFNSLHAFIQEEKWLKQLKRIGFKETKGKSLVLPL